MEYLLPLNQIVDLIVIGGGAAGYMAAITSAEKGVSSIVILEAQKKPLEKVRISGGGRCNVTHACWDPRDLVTNYPRGSLALKGAFSRFATGDAVAWFAEHGIDLVEEEDGRMFPFANTSSAVVECLKNSATNLGVKLVSNFEVKKVENHLSSYFLITSKAGQSLISKMVLLATGSSPSGRVIASNFGHKIINPVPSLFSLSIKSSPFKHCSGTVIDDVKLILHFKNKSFEERGKFLITHWGFSGPAVLRLSAFAARSLNENKYNGQLFVDWVGCSTSQVRKMINSFRYTNAIKQIDSAKLFSKFSKRFWIALLSQVEIDPKMRWSELSREAENLLVSALTRSAYEIKGRGPYADEFVTAGGVELDEIDFLSMESRYRSGLYFAGEILDVDGITGGFNFQHCWTSGWLAGKAIAASF